jgi:beta-N-acetylhexosaminidase
MIIVRGDKEEYRLTNLNIGGIFLDKQDAEKDYENIIANFQEKSKIRLFAATDLEGAWNPFSNFYESKSLADIEDADESYNLGKNHGENLKRIGFNINFAPVAEWSDKAYGERAFSGNKEEVKGKLKNYILGLQENVLGVCKHYPGKGMIGNLHIKKDYQEISEDDLELFNACIENNVSGVMVGHQIVSGELNSDGRQASVSREVIGNIPENVLIVSDLINMNGLRYSYFFSKRRLYADLINAGENIVLDWKFGIFGSDSYDHYKKLINRIEKDVESGKIDEGKINESVKKILLAKGYKIKNG